jgi:transposase
MRPALSLTKVFLYQQPIDFRKAHLGLCAIIECELGHDPFAGHLYAFTNKRRNKIKCLFWEDCAVLQKPVRGKIQVAKAE